MPQETKHSKTSSTWLILMVLIIAVILGISVFILSHQSKKSGDESPLSPTRKIQSTPTASPSASVSSEEQKKIDAWIEKNNLNEYGDPVDTNYAGGTPLFNETTGETRERYEYIVEQFPDKPWMD